MTLRRNRPISIYYSPPALGIVNLNDRKAVEFKHRFEVTTRTTANTKKTVRAIHVAHRSVVCVKTGIKGQSLFSNPDRSTSPHTAVSAPTAGAAIKAATATNTNFILQPFCLITCRDFSNAHQIGRCAQISHIITPVPNRSH